MEKAEFKSIRVKLWLSITSLILLILVLIWLFQTVLLKEFYIQKRTHTLLREGRKIVSLFMESDYHEGIPQSVIDEINNFSSSPIDTNILLFDSNSNIIHSNLFRMPPILRNIIENSISDFNKKLNIQSEIIVDEAFILRKTPTATSISKAFIVVAVPIEKDGKFIGNILLISPNEKIEEVVSILKEQLSIIGLSSLIIATIIALLFSKFLTIPILKITEASKKIAEGDLNVDLNIDSKDELGTLGYAINNMAYKLSQVEQLREEVMANTSHELKTPIGIIRSYAELIQIMDIDQTKRNEYLEIIIDESKRLNNMIGDILCLSEMKAGYITPFYSKFNLCKVIDNVLLKLSFLASEKNLKLITQLDDPYVFVEGDKDKIYQVIYNLVNNAINHSFENRSITIKTITNEQKIILYIIDQGKGISKTNLPYIWDRFYKSNAIGKSKGTGLGMSIVKNILELHNFKYGIESEVNKGTTLWIELNKIS